MSIDETKSVDDMVDDVVYSQLVYINTLPPEDLTADMRVWVKEIVRLRAESNESEKFERIFKELRRMSNDQVNDEIENIRRRPSEANNIG